MGALREIDVARAIAKANLLAGSSVDWQGKDEIDDRAERLVSQGYVRLGDPYGWDPGGRPKAFVLCESRGGVGDCVEPFDYFGKGVEQTCVASENLPGYFFEWINAAVVLVYRS